MSSFSYFNCVNHDNFFLFTYYGEIYKIIISQSKTTFMSICTVVELAQNILVFVSASSCT